MREVCFEDELGRKFARLIPDDAPDTHALFGITVGPPDLSGLNLPTPLEVRLNNILYARRLLTRSDVRRRKQELFACWQAALQVDVTTLNNLYELEA